MRNLARNTMQELLPTVVCHPWRVGFRRLAWIFCWLAYGTVAAARGVVEDHTVVWLGQEQGLPSGGATAMAQAKDGHLWFGTFGGVARFDGTEFKVFNPANTPEIPSAGIANVFCERSGKLWVSTYGGMASLTDGRWHRHGPDDGWTADCARTFSEGPDGTVYVTAFNGKVLRYAQGRFEEMPPVPDERLGGFGHCDPQGRFWVAKDAFIGFWDGMAWKRVDAPLENGGRIAGERELIDGIGAGSARDGSLWVILHRLLLRVNASGVAQRVLLDQPVETFWKLYEDRHGDVWICSRDHGVYHVRITPQTTASMTTHGQVTLIESAAGREFSSVPFVSEDDEGNLWMGTASEGMARWSPRLFKVAGREEGLTHGNARSISVGPDGRLWVAFYGGGVFRCDNPTADRPRFHATERHATAEAESVLADKSGHVWATRLGNGGPVFRIESGSPQVFYTESTERIARWGLHEDARGVLWVAGPGELLSHKDGRWARHSPKDVHVIAEDRRSNTLWMGGRNGVHRYDAGGFVPVHDATGTPFPPITSLHPAPSGGMWIGTDSEGLILRRADGGTARIGPGQGLPMKIITVIHADGTGLLWLGGEMGIACIAEAEVIAVASGVLPRIQTRLFGPEDGLPGNCHLLHASTPSLAQTADGRLWFPTSRGVVSVHPQSIPRDARPPRVLASTLVHVDADGTSHEEPWSLDAPYSFAPGTRSIRFNFSVLSYAAPQRVLGRVRLHRADRLVSERLGPERSVSWDLLPPGDYSLTVSAANETGQWSRESKPTRFSVQPHYWQTNAFRAGISIATLAGILALAANRVRNVQMASRLALAERDRIAAIERAQSAEALRHSERLRQQAESEALWHRRKEAVVRDVHDGIGGLTSNLKMTVNLALGTRDEKLRSTLLKNLDSLVGETLVEVHGLMDTLESEVATCGDLADEFRRHGNLMLEPHQIPLTVRAHLPQTPLPKDPRFFPSIFRIYKESITNIVKHSRSSRVEVSVEAHPEWLRVVISDNGVGLSEIQPRGRGLANMRKRTAELGGQISLNTANGLKLELVIPWTASDCANTPARPNPTPSPKNT